jgi:hypothetical protein
MGAKDVPSEKCDVIKPFYPETYVLQKETGITVGLKPLLLIRQFQKEIHYM